MDLNRSILFLQGVASPFFSSLAERLADEGCAVYRVNFCGGDCLFDHSFHRLVLQKVKRTHNGNHKTTWDYQDPIEQFPFWLGKKLVKHAITDIVLFGDSRPVHVEAIKLANLKNINIHVYEEGYVRPCRITLEKNGVNANSSLPQNADWYHKNGGKFPTHTVDNTGNSLLIRAWHDARYHLASFVMRKKFPYYSTHRPDSPLTEYMGWAKRFPTLLFHDWNSNRIVADLIKAKTEFYFLPLQLSADTQIRIHSSFENVSQVIEHTIRSFADHAPAHTKLLIKNHPLDTGLVNYKKLIKTLEQQHQLTGRVVYLEDGYLPTMVRKAKGVVLVNSTVGTSSLFHRRPTCVLGEAVYNMQGLTYQGGLDRFWTEGKPPEVSLYHKFFNTLVHLTQVNGDLYSSKGIKMSVEGSMRFFGYPVLQRVPTTAKIDRNRRPVKVAQVAKL